MRIKLIYQGNGRRKKKWLVETKTPLPVAVIHSGWVQHLFFFFFIVFKIFILLLFKFHTHTHTHTHTDTLLLDNKHPCVVCVIGDKFQSPKPKRITTAADWKKKKNYISSEIHDWITTFMLLSPDPHMYTYSQKKNQKFNWNIHVV
jgi:hypothetical protein